tara:strand:- start:120 stop:692 length:573 start_codon:yes stop_codon:yes gene_type:complete
MKQKKPSHKVEEEWKNFVDKNKIVRKKSDAMRNVFQESKSLSSEVHKLSRLKSVDNIEPNEKKTQTKKKEKKSEESLFKVVEKNKLKKIKQGKFNPEKTLDLHGFSLLKAEEELRQFIELCIRENKRFVLVITGKGRNSNEIQGTEKRIIKTSLPVWLKKSFYMDKIQYFSFASQRHGDTGAYYIFLKRL